MAAPEWTRRRDGSHVAKIGRYEVRIFPPQQWQFYRGEHGGVPTHKGPGESRTIGFHASANDGMSASAFTLAGAKAKAAWIVANDLTGRAPPDSIYPPAELKARALWVETVARVNAIHGEV